MQTQFLLLLSNYMQHNITLQKSELNIYIFFLVHFGRDSMFGSDKFFARVYTVVEHEPVSYCTQS